MCSLPLPWGAGLGKGARAHTVHETPSPAAAARPRPLAVGEVRIVGLRRGGFAMILALVLLALTAVALTGLTQLSAAEFRRTREVQVEAQLRQMLLAGAADVQQRAARWPAEGVKLAWNLPLPVELNDPSASLSVAVGPESGDRVVVEVVATVDGRSQRQTLVMSREAGRWRATDARLGELP